MEEKIDFAECELFLVVAEGSSMPFLICNRMKIPELLGLGTVDAIGKKAKCRVFTFPQLKEITKARIKIMLQESE